MKSLFELAVGSIQGREHLRLTKNNQDAYHTLSNEQFTIAVVCDGCSSGLHSEVGAQIGARLLVDRLAKALSSQSIQENQSIPRELLEQVHQDLLSEIKSSIEAMGGNWLQTLKDYFLFTIIGVVITSTDLLVFSLGDGVIVINGRELDLGCWTNNAPPYLAYGLSCEVPRQDLLFQVHSLPPLEEVESILIGTDGVRDLIKAAQQQLPGKQELVGSIDQFWRQDRYFTNPDQVRRRLSLINREVTKFDSQKQQLDKQVGLLSDDTTLVVLRRRRSF
ncbi:MAG: protein phosphatase 2C domain-containing protein [Pleurocapsa sp. MO_192.B19]|nr:protein phosphatase 2C domain-containing protein [Pleurocapsa sp. MO_192.B19]